MEALPPNLRKGFHPLTCLPQNYVLRGRYRDRKPADREIFAGFLFFYKKPEKWLQRII